MNQIQAAEMRQIMTQAVRSLGGSELRQVDTVPAVALTDLERAALMDDSMGEK